MTQPTVFGAVGTRLLAGGEAGAEAILPLEPFYQRLSSILDSKYEKLKENKNEGKIEAKTENKAEDETESSLEGIIENKEYVEFKSDSVDALVSMVAKYAYANSLESVMTESESKVGQNIDFRG